MRGIFRISKKTVKDRSTVENDANFKKLSDATQKKVLEGLDKNSGDASARGQVGEALY